MTEHVSGRRIVAGGLAGLALGAAALIGAFPGAAGATGDTGDHDDLPFNHPCPGDGWYFHWGPDNQETIPGEHNQDDPAIDEPSSDEPFTVEITNVRLEGEQMTLDFATSVPVRLALAMGYPRTDSEPTTEYYDPAATQGTISVDDDTYIKHIVFCPGEMPDDTTTTSESTTTTAPDDTTTTTAPDDTTTTTAPPTSEEPPTSVEPTTPPSSEAPTTEAPPTTVPASDEELPETGSNTMPLVAGAAALVAVGVALVTGRRFLNGRSAS